MQWSNKILIKKVAFNVTFLFLIRITYITNTQCTMKILTKAIENAFKKQGYTGNKSAKDIKVVMKMFGGPFTFYLYEKQDDDTYMAFCNLGDSQMAECGTVSMSELMSIRLKPFDLPLERDMHFTPLSISLQDVIDKVKSGGHV